MMWIEASRIGRRPSGVVYCESVFLQYSKPQRAEDAIEQALAGRTVFVQREDAPAVLAALAEKERQVSNELRQTDSVG